MLWAPRVDFTVLSHVLCFQSRMMKKSGRDNKTAVVVGTLTDDARIFEIPKLKVHTLFFFCIISPFVL